MDKIFGFLSENAKNDNMRELHAMFGDPDYKLFTVATAALSDFIKKREFDGLNVDAPFGKRVMPLLSKNSESARRLGYVNTVYKLHDGKLYGDNTDVFGFSYLLDFLGIDVEGKYCVIIGEGGSAPAVKAVLAERKARRVETLNLGKLSGVSKHLDCEIIINASNIGKGEKIGISPISLEGLDKLSCVIDLISDPMKTALLMDAEGRGIAAYNGIPMLVAQTKKSRELFYFATIEDKYIPPVIARYTGCMLNITLIGLPGCMKDELGALLAEKLGRKLYDLDKTIARLYGKTREDMVKANGVAEFKRAEHVAAEWAGKRRGVVISAGEGIVERSDNLRPLAQNGIIIFLNRPESLIDTRKYSFYSDTSDAERDALIEKYRSWCHAEIINDGDPSSDVQKILSCISL